MERTVTKLDNSHSQIKFSMQGIGERDAWMRTFPNPMPSTHTIHYRWDGMNLIVEPRLIASPSAGEGVPPSPSPADETDEELHTLAAEKGVKLKKGMSRAQIVAAIGDAVGRG